MVLPPGLGYFNNACYQLTVLNAGSGSCCTSTGKVYRRWVWIDPIPYQLASVAVFQPDSIHVPVVNSDSLSHSVTYRIVGRSADGDSTNQTVMLNGLPPGVPVLGTLDLAPQTTNLINLTAMLADYEPTNFWDIVIECSVDGGPYEDLGAYTLQSNQPATITGVSVPPPVEALSGLAVKGNPFGEETTVIFRLGVPQEVEANVYDVSGRLVRTLQKGKMEAGVHDLRWDGRNEAGLARNGVYFVRLQTAGRVYSAKVVRMK
jgi:hypothetical protein